MNDFFLAANRTFQFSDIEVKQIQMKSLDLFSQHAETVKEFLADKNYSDEILIELFKAHTVEVIHTCVMTSNLTADRIFDIAKDQALFLDMLRAVLTVNTAYFKPEKPKRRTKQSNEKSTWFDSFQYLIDCGHRHDDIMNMPYGAFTQYLKAAQRNELRKMRSQVNLMRSAQHAQNREFKKLLEDLKVVD
ncbi:hypothetical protein [Acinetobacter sp. ANC 5045]|uniref:hypothetical protein n=1 Tax=Acinetobacter sp. ANC 5045 TaxID=2529851 RepID=UPI0010409EBA|nr:hypothetical protein [Acinetobacter sp. ANC 5045]TCB17320.1 hypothetical protein E0H79_08715 [Acinetobacter sp. ANC 5045]